MAMCLHTAAEWAGLVSLCLFLDLCVTLYRRIFQLYDPDHDYGERKLSRTWKKPKTIRWLLQALLAKRKPAWDTVIHLVEVIGSMWAYPFQSGVDRDCVIFVQVTSVECFTHRDWGICNRHPYWGSYQIMKPWGMYLLINTSNISPIQWLQKNHYNCEMFYWALNLIWANIL